MKKLGLIINENTPQPRSKNNSTEFQMFGIYLAESLNDTAHYSLYIRLAKVYPRALLEEALSFAKGYTQAKSKAKVFMWRLKQLKSLRFAEGKRQGSDD